MAGYNEILTGRYNRALQKLLSMKGPASMNELSSVLYPSFNFFWGSEMRYLEGWARFGQGFNLTAGAGFNATVRIRNATTNVVAVVEMVTIFAGGTAVTFDIEGPTPTTTDLATNISPFCTRFDARGPQATTMNVTQDGTAAHANNGNTILQCVADANFTSPLLAASSQEITILPGDALQFRDPNTGQQLGFSVWWRERQLEDSELK